MLALNRVVEYHNHIVTEEPDMNNDSDTKMLVNNGFTVLIVETLILKRREEYFPGSDPDKMDNRISACHNRVKLLRKMRDEYEDEMSKPL